MVNAVKLLYGAKPPKRGTIPRFEREVLTPATYWQASYRTVYGLTGGHHKDIWVVELTWNVKVPEYMLIRGRMYKVIKSIDNVAYCERVNV